MTYNGEIERSQDAGVAILRIVRPAKKNALTLAMYASLVDGLRAGEADDAIGVHLILGTPGAFCAGNDLSDFMAASQSGEPDLADVLRFLDTLACLEKPLVIGVDGLAVGIGTTMLLHADLAYVSDRSVFRTPFVDLGLVPEAASTLLGPRLMGHARAFELLCLGAPFDAMAAREAGLVNRVLGVEGFEGTVLDVARALAAKPRQAMLMTRQLLKSGASASRPKILARIALEAEHFRGRLMSDEARAAFAAFLGRK